MIVADATVIIDLVVPSSQTVHIERTRMIDPTWIAPFFWRSECIASFWKMLTRGQIDRRAAFAAIERLESAVAFSLSAAPRDILELAVASKHSPYDCEYVALARRMSVKLLTLDVGVLEKFRDVAISPFAFCRRAEGADA